MGDKIKFERFLAQDGLPDFFRELADIIEDGQAGDPELSTALNNFEKLKIGVEEAYGRLAVKVRIKCRDAAGAVRPSEETQEAGQSRPKYKTLKKRMKKSFKVIASLTAEGTLPPADAVDEFLSDSVLMVSYPEMGDEYYEEYSRTCDALAKAYDAKDAAACAELCMELARLKKECHNRYK